MRRWCMARATNIQSTMYAMTQMSTAAERLGAEHAQQLADAGADAQDRIRQLEGAHAEALAQAAAAAAKEKEGALGQLRETFAAKEEALLRAQEAATEAAAQVSQSVSQSVSQLFHSFFFPRFFTVVLIQ